MLGVIGINGLGIDRLLLEKVWLWLSCAIGYRHIGWDAVMVLLWRDSDDCHGLARPKGRITVTSVDRVHHLGQSDDHGSGRELVPHAI